MNKRCCLTLLSLMLVFCLFSASAESAQEAEPVITAELSTSEVEAGANISVNWTVENPPPGQEIRVIWIMEGKIFSSKVFETVAEGTMEAKVPDYFGGSGSVEIELGERAETGYLLRLKKTLLFTVKGEVMPKIINLKIDKEGEVQGGEVVTATWEVTAPLPENCGFHVEWKSSGHFEDRYAENFTSSFETRFSDPDSYVIVYLFRGYEPYEPEDGEWVESYVQDAKKSFVVAGETPPKITGTCSAQGGVVQEGEAVTITWEVEHMPKGGRVDLYVNAGTYYILKGVTSPFTFVPKYKTDRAYLMLSVEEEAYDETPWKKPFDVGLSFAFKVEGEAAPTITAAFNKEKVRPGEEITISWEIGGNAKDTRVEVGWCIGEKDPEPGEVVGNTSTVTVPMDFSSTELMADFSLLTLDGQKIREDTVVVQVVFQGDATGDGEVNTEDLAALTEHWFKGVEEAGAIENAIADPEKGVQISDLLAVIELIVGD